MNTTGVDAREIRQSSRLRSLRGLSIWRDSVFDFLHNKPITKIPKSGEHRPPLFPSLGTPLSSTQHPWIRLLVYILSGTIRYQIWWLMVPSSTTGSIMKASLLFFLCVCHRRENVVFFLWCLRTISFNPLIVWEIASSCRNYSICYVSVFQLGVLFRSRICSRNWNEK